MKFVILDVISKGFKEIMNQMTIDKIEGMKYLEGKSMLKQYLEIIMK